jgi:hypothetical protein
VANLKHTPPLSFLFNKYFFRVTYRFILDSWQIYRLLDFIPNQLSPFFFAFLNDAHNIQALRFKDNCEFCPLSRSL